MDIGSVTATTLSAYDVVILAPAVLTAGQVSMLSTWVTAGGNFIAMQPDAQLNSLLGLTSAGATLSNADMCSWTHQPRSATALSTSHPVSRQRRSVYPKRRVEYCHALLESTAATPNPAVTLRSVGSNGGRPRHSLTTSQHRSSIRAKGILPGRAGARRICPIRSDDKFFGAAVR